MAARTCLASLGPESNTLHINDGLADLTRHTIYPTQKGLKLSRIICDRYRGGGEAGARVKTADARGRETDRYRQRVVRRLVAVLYLTMADKELIR
jgi:hypothetical protein